MTNPENPQRYNTVMVVDDNEIDRYVAETVIRRSDFARNIVCADCVTDAINYIEQHMQAPEELPEVIFLDINMPELTGFDFLERYDAFPEEIKRNCIIMMLTSSLDAKDHKLANTSKYVSMFLNKPLCKEKLAQVRKEHITFLPPTSPSGS